MHRKLGDFCKEFWTDGNAVNDLRGESTCMPCEPPIKNLCNNKLMCPLLSRMWSPKGRLCCACDAKIEGIFSALDHA